MVSPVSENQERVLIVDDDEAVLTMLKRVVESNGIEANTVISGETALLELSRSNYDLILLDINLGGMDGFEVIKTLRSHACNTPIIVISGRREDYDALYGLNIGADDYITKPFNPVTLGAKVKAMLRRCHSAERGEDWVISAGPFTYNTSTLRFYKNGEEVYLSAKENAMMKLFIDNTNHIFAKEALYELLWGSTIIDENAINVYMNRLRQKIEDDPSAPKYLQTVRGMGYKFVI